MRVNSWDSFSLAEHIPLQQGLRLRRRLRGKSSPSELAEHIPLQQGLRRTRGGLASADDTSQSIFHYNKG